MYSMTPKIRGTTIPGMDGFALVREINNGFFGRVYEAVELTTKKSWACKVVDKASINEKQKRGVEQEVCIDKEKREKKENEKEEKKKKERKK